MTLTELWNDLPKLADYLGVEYKDGIKPDYSRRTGYKVFPSAVTKPANEVVVDAFSEHCRANHAEWMKSRHNPFKPLTWTRMVQEALTELGITGGTVAQRIERLKAQKFHTHERTRKEFWYTTAQFDGPEEEKTPFQQTWEELKKEIGMAAA